MESNYFFKSDLNTKFKGKTGIYVIKSPLQYNGEDMFKVGYAYNSLSKRIADYRTAFGIIPFNIYCIYEIPERIFGSPRTMWALGSEKQLHKTLFKDAIMVNEDSGKIEGEWYYNLDNIMNAVIMLRQEHLNKIENAYKWEMYLYNQENKINTRSSNLKLSDILDSNSQFTKIQPRQRTTRNKPNTKYSYDYDTDHNPSRNFMKDKYIYKNI